MKIMIALAAGLLATGASAQTTVTTTRTTPTHQSTVVRTSESRHMEMRDHPRTRVKRVCHNRWRHGHRVRVCRTVRVRY